MDMLAPAKKKVIVNKARAPWYTDELRLLRNNVRRLERAWLSSPLEINKQIFHGARTSYHDECERAKTQYHRSRIQSANTRKLFAVVDEITGDKKSTGAILPKHNDPQQMAQDFSDFFCGKIRKLRDTFHDVTKPSLPPCPPSHSFSNFKPITRDDATKRISAMNSKSSALDPMPTQLVKLCLPE